MATIVANQVPETFFGEIGFRKKNFLSFIEFLTYLKMFSSVNHFEGAAKICRIANTMQNFLPKMMKNLILKNPFFSRFSVHNPSLILTTNRASTFCNTKVLSMSTK